MNLLEIKIQAINDAIAILKGNFSNGIWIVLFFCSICAIFMSIYMQFHNKKRKGTLNELNPDRFSWAYAIFDNFGRIIVGMIAMFFLFRLASIFISPKLIESDDMIIILGLGVGFFASLGVDRLIAYLMQHTSIFDSPNPYKKIVETENKSE